MRKSISVLILSAMFAACSAPKYTYHFDHYDYNSGKKQTVTANTNNQMNESPLILEQQSVVASAETTPAPVVKEQITATEKKAIATKLASLSKEEKRELKQNLKSEIKKIVKEKKALQGQTVNETKAWDYDLKMAAIFGAIGLVLTALGGVNGVFWILGAIALIVGVVFLIKWLARQ